MKKSMTVKTHHLMTGAALAGFTLSAMAGTDTVVSTAGSTSAPGAAPAAMPQVQKPAWLTDLSATVKETYDDNVLLVSGDGPLKPQASAVSTVAAKVGFNFAPLITSDSVLEALTLTYSPEWDIYHNAPDETFDAHRINDSVKGKVGGFSYVLDNALLYVDGSDVAPTYSGTDRYRSGFASVVPKERRKQVQDRAKVVLQYDWDAFFFRPTASLLAYDMMTQFHTTTGYQNYPSRYDLNGGADVGYRVTKDLALTLGYRYGHQYQQMLPVAEDATQLASSSDYQRVLAGIEGKPLDWLTLAVLAGPDFRNYCSTAGVADKNQTTYYGEASATATLSDNDLLSLKYKQWRWVAYTGRLPYFDSNYELNWHHKLTSQFSFDLGGRIASYDFTCGYDPKKLSNERLDYLFSIVPGVSYAFNQHFSVTASGSIDFGRNLFHNPPGGVDYREFDHDLASVAATYKF